MSRAGVCRTLATVVALASLVSCKKWLGNNTGEFVANAKSPIHINFSCDGTNTIGLVDDDGIPAWTFRVKKKNPISWAVPTNVTILSIVGKTAADPLPVDQTPNDPKGGAPGVPFGGKAKDISGFSDKHVLYKIAVRCIPTAPGSSPVDLLIDPEMIVRPR